MSNCNGKIVGLLAALGDTSLSNIEERTQHSTTPTLCKVTGKPYAAYNGDIENVIGEIE